MRRFAAIQEIGTLLLLVLVVLFAGAQERRFLQVSSLNSVLLWVPLIVVVGMGQMMVIITRGIDVSVGSMLGFAGIVVGMLFRSNPELNVFAALGIGAAIGLGLGCVNGALVAWTKIPPIIVTLGTWSAFRGLTFIVSKGEQIDSNDLPETLMRWSLDGPVRIGHVTLPWLSVMALLVALAASWFLRRTRAGRDIFALGSNPEAARLRGVPVTRTTFIVYAITGALAGMAGVMYASRFGFVNPATAGQGFELTVIAAVAIGGTRVTGGSGTVLGVVLGSLLLGTINVALTVLPIGATYQLLVYGLVILVALLLDAYVRRATGRFQGAA